LILTPNPWITPMSRSRAMRSATVGADKDVIRAISELERRPSSSNKARISRSFASRSCTLRIKSPAPFATWLFGYLNRLQIKGKPVEQEQFSGHFAPKPSKVPDRKERREVPGYAGLGADHATFGAGVAIVIVEGVADEAAVAGQGLLP